MVGSPKATINLRNMMTTASDTAPRKNRTICVNFCQDQFDSIIQNPVKFRCELDKEIEKYPELFPSEICSGYKMKDIRQTKKLSCCIRRIKIGDVNYTVRLRL